MSQVLRVSVTNSKIKLEAIKSHPKSGCQTNGTPRLLLVFRLQSTVLIVAGRVHLPRFQAQRPGHAEGGELHKTNVMPRYWSIPDLWSPCATSARGSLLQKASVVRYLQPGIWIFVILSSGCPTYNLVISTRRGFPSTKRFSRLADNLCYNVASLAEINTIATM